MRLPRMPHLEAVGRLIVRQAVIEGFGLPGYGLTLASPAVEGLGVSPADPRPPDPRLGRAVYEGRFAFAGSVLTAPAPDHPWAHPAPDRAFAVELHRFAWMPGLMALGDAGAVEALRLTLAWIDTFSAWRPFTWGREVLSRRVFNLACAARRLAMAGNPDQAVAVGDTLARQARHLLRLPEGRAWSAEHAAAAALAGAALSGKAGERLLTRALARLTPALHRTVLPDGTHASRSPEAGMELLLDLTALDDALHQRGTPAPPELGRTLDRMSLVLRTLTLGDGRLACFQGGEASSLARVAAARARDDAFGIAPEVLPDGRYHRLQGQMLQALVDAGAPAQGAYSTSACAQPLAIEVVCGKDRLITNTGWSPRQPERQGHRLTAGGSTLSLGGASVLAPLQGRLSGALGPRLDGPPFQVEARREADEGAALLVLAHDGWAPRFGLIHERTLYLDIRADELRGEDLLFPAEGARPKVMAAPFACRFHLHPDVQVSASRDHKSVLLRGLSGRGWWFRSDAAEVTVEASSWFENGWPRKSAQVVLKAVARTEGRTRVRWKISPAGGPGDLERF